MKSKENRPRSSKYTTEQDLLTTVVTKSFFESENDPLFQKLQAHKGAVSTYLDEYLFQLSKYTSDNQPKDNEQ
jgi:hypothetical protein